MRKAGWKSVLLGLVFVGASLFAPALRAQPAPAEGAVRGRVLDAETGEPVPYTQVLLEEIGRSGTAGEDGRFEIVNLRPGAYTLETYRIGYGTLTRRVQVPPGDTLRLTLRVSPSAVRAGEVIVRGRRAEAEGLAEADVALEGAALRRHLGATIAETLDEEPGLAMRSMGPAPARPVLRGLGGERLLVLEDGGRTGDLSASSSDHALVIEPITAERVEVLRGPAVLRYGSNALAGVINVARGYVPTSRPADMEAELTTQAASVNRSYAAGLGLTAPAGPFAVQADGSVRRAQDLHTPAGVLDNTSLATYNASAGASLVESWGYAGAAGSYYQSDYGIPGGFVGAHPEGVSITLERYHLEARGAYLPSASLFDRIEARADYSRYHHKEFESDGLLGVEFGVVSYHGAVTAYTGAFGPFDEGAVGLWGAYRDYASGGLSSTPRSVERALAGFVYQGATWAPFTLKAGLRYDVRAVRPRHEFEADIGSVRDRTFGGFSACVSGAWQATGGLTTGLRLMRSLRLPGIIELYSEGPHLAAYTYEVGNPNLDAEKGYGAELFADYRSRRFTAGLAFYAYYITDYIFPRNTGEPSVVQVPIYQYTGATARMAGGEASARWQFTDALALDGTLSYVRGTLTETETPLPQIPPLQGALGLSYKWEALTLGATLRAAGPQNRVYTFLDPAVEGIAEAPTDGYAVLDLSAQYYFVGGGLLHTINFGVENALNTIYRDHLARVRIIMPEPGRNVTLLYRVHF